MTISSKDDIVDHETDDSLDGTVEKVIPITGIKYVIYVLWGEKPETPEYQKYGFNTMDEARAFMCGISEADGWFGWFASYSAETFGKDNDWKASTEEEFRADIINEYDF